MEMTTRVKRVVNGMTFVMETDLTPRTLLKFDADNVICRKCGECVSLSKNLAQRSTDIAYEFLKDHARDCLLITGDKLDAELKNVNRGRKKK